jgi:hypothetical protein
MDISPPNIPCWSAQLAERAAIIKVESLFVNLRHKRRIRHKKHKKEGGKFVSSSPADFVPYVPFVAFFVAIDRRIS